LWGEKKKRRVGQRSFVEKKKEGEKGRRFWFVSIDGDVGREKKGTGTDLFKKEKKREWEKGGGVATSVQWRKRRGGGHFRGKGVIVKGLTLIQQKGGGGKRGQGMLPYYLT